MINGTDLAFRSTFVLVRTMKPFIKIKNIGIFKNLLFR